MAVEGPMRSSIEQQAVEDMICSAVGDGNHVCGI